MFKGPCCLTIVTHACSRCPWYFQPYKQETKALRPVSLQQAQFLELLLTWTPPSCSPQLEHLTLRMKSPLQTTGAMRHKQDIQTKTKTLNLLLPQSPIWDVKNVKWIYRFAAHGSYIFKLLHLHCSPYTWASVLFWWLTWKKCSCQ